VIEIGRIVRLQVQTASLKLGERPNRVYDPSPLREVPCLRLTPRGAAGVRDGAPLLDVHHGDHPATKWEAGREASFGFTSHYGRMRDEYGGHLVNGCAGENVLVESTEVWTLEDLTRSAGLAFRGAESGSLLRLANVTVAEPCVEFSRFAIRTRAPEASPQELKPVLQFLSEGTRGYVFTPESDGEVAIGDRLVILT
jgi:hypothetical protein